MGVAILGLKNKGGFQNLQDSGGPFGLWRVKFSRGGGWISKKEKPIVLFFYLQRAILA